MRAYYRLGHDARLYVDDCIAVMADLPPESVDAVVCDPPYELGFMGKGWDSAGVAFAPSTWAEALRVLKPGGHLLAFGGTRTFHRITVAIEDAGFEVRDCLSWLYGQGFPKSLDVSKAIDKAAGVWRGKSPGKVSGNGAMANGNYVRVNKGEPATDAAREWQGWGTALKPAWEPCVVARKPLAGTVAANVQAHGTGALNIDGCRIDSPAGDGVWGTSNATTSPTFNGSPTHADYRSQQHPAGRWPANVALDEAAAAMLDAQSGTLTSGRLAPGHKQGHGNAVKMGNGGTIERDYGGDTGGASRFFYVAKASKRDRGEGNTHPTVKPTALMRWLVRLVAPPGGIVLDPFAGSGTTLVACRAEGVRCIGIEREQEYAAIIAARMAEAEADEPTLFDAA